MSEGETNLFTTVPHQISSGKPGQLNEEQLQKFFREVDNFFDKTLLDKVRKEIEEKVDELALRLLTAGKVKSMYKEYGLFQRLTKLDADFPGANIVLHKTGILPMSFRKLWSDEKLLNVAEQILGTGDIVGNPVWNLRCKTPRNEASVVPWHQDTAYMDPEDCKKMVFTTWIPLLDTNENNGGMQMMRGGQRAAQVAEHKCCYGGTWYVMLEEEEMKKTLDCDPAIDIVTCRVPYGGAIFFSNMIPHRSLPNTSNDIRWALDLRFNRQDVPAGFWGLKEGVLLRSSSDPDMEIDWDSFQAIDRTEKQFEAVNVKQEEFDTTIHGPWMKRWDIVHMNRHTDALAKAESAMQMPSVIG